MISKIVLVGGCFDMLHVGHVEFLRKSRSFGDYLIVLLESDENIKKLKGREDIFRVRKGNLRIIYRIEKEEIFILTVERRSEKTYRDY